MPEAAIDRAGLDQLFGALERRGFTAVGPTGARRGDRLRGARLGGGAARGWTDVQDGGHYRLARREDDALFGYNVGPELVEEPSCSRRRCALWKARRAADGGLEVRRSTAERRRYAFIGVRSCDLHAIAVQDRTFLDGRLRRPRLRGPPRGRVHRRGQLRQGRRRRASASRWTRARARPPASTSRSPSCSRTAATASSWRSGSERGAEVLAELPHRAAGAARRGGGGAGRCEHAAADGTELDTTDIRDLLYRNREHPRWDEVADRCLTCGNCTMVCPTCFCTHASRT